LNIIRIAGLVEVTAPPPRAFASSRLGHGLLHRAGRGGAASSVRRARSRRRRTTSGGSNTAPSGPAIAAAPREHLLWPRPRAWRHPFRPGRRSSPRRIRAAQRAASARL